MCSPVTTTAGLTGRATTYHTMEPQYFWRDILEGYFGGIFWRDVLEEYFGGQEERGN